MSNNCKVTNETNDIFCLIIKYNKNTFIQQFIVYNSYAVECTKNILFLKNKSNFSGILFRVFSVVSLIETLS